MGEDLVGSLLLVGLGRSVVLGLLALVRDGVAGGLEAVGVSLVSSNCEIDEDMGGKAYRVPMPALLSLATSLLASLEAPEVAAEGRVSV